MSLRRHESHDQPAADSVLSRVDYFTAEDAEGAEGGCTAMEINEVSGEIVDAAIQVHTALGPDLLESAYEACLAFELRERGLDIGQQLSLPVIYKGIKVDASYRIDLLVEKAIVVEAKAVERLLPIHEAQLLSYLKLSGFKVGLLINFNVIHLRNGIKRLVNGL